MSLLALAEPAARSHRRPRFAPLATTVGDFIALPILRTPEGDGIDLAEYAAGRPVVLGVVRGGAAEGAAMMRALAAGCAGVEARSVAVIAVVTGDPGRPATRWPRSDHTVTVALDRGGRFTQSLGLMAAAGPACFAPPRSVTYGLAPCGRVIFARRGDGATPDAATIAGATTAIARLRRAAQPLGWGGARKSDAQLFMESFA